MASTQYPNILGGQDVTADALNSMTDIFAYKTASTVRASNTALADDPDLTITLAANATYFVEIMALYGTTGVAGFQTTWTVPSGVSGTRSNISIDVASNVDGANSMCLSGFPFGTARTHGSRNSVGSLCTLRQEAIITTTTSGTCAFRWAQVSSTAVNTTVGAGSYMRARRLA